MWGCGDVVALEDVEALVNVGSLGCSGSGDAVALGMCFITEQRTRIERGGLFLSGSSMGVL
jgi:hypothetical protein